MSEKGAYAKAGVDVDIEAKASRIMAYPSPKEAGSSMGISSIEVRFRVS